MPSHYATGIRLEEPVMTECASTKRKVRSNLALGTIKPIPPRIVVWNLPLLDGKDDLPRGEDFSQDRGTFAAITKTYDVDPDVPKISPTLLLIASTLSMKLD